MVDNVQGDNQTRTLHNNPTEAQLERLAGTHVFYGYPGKAWGHWTEEQKKIYYAAYRAALQAKEKA